MTTNITKPLKIIFAGTPEFAVPSLKALLAAQHDVVAVYTQPDRPAGRGRQLTASPVKQFAVGKGLTVEQPTTLKTTEVQKQILDYVADVMIVVAYGLMIPSATLNALPNGCINVHASLLPRWRGAAPIQRAILAGDAETGVTIMQMAAGLDTGDMLYTISTPIQSTDTSQLLHDKLAELGATALLTTLTDLKQYQQNALKQDDKLATYAAKITKQEARIDWQQSAVTIAHMIRAFNPWPVAFTELSNKVIRCWAATVIDVDKIVAQPGCIINTSKAGIDIACGQGVLRLTQLQLPGGKVLPLRDVLNAKSIIFSNGACLY